MDTSPGGYPEAGLSERNSPTAQSGIQFTGCTRDRAGNLRQQTLQKTLKENVKKSLTALKEEQKLVEEQIHQLIQADERLKELFDLMVSVPGVGPVIATELLIATAGRPRNEMQTINEPKKLACHAGVAPFDRAACAVPFG